MLAASETSINFYQTTRCNNPEDSHLEDEDLYGFSNKETRKSKIVNMVCAMRNFENTNKERLESNACKVGFHHMTDRHHECCHDTERRRRGWER
jgi:hypothetical protein